MGEQAAQARAAAVESFAASLRELRAQAGTPSFRELAGRSRAISHTTLHEAAQGNRLPSWATTAEFVKACGADPAAYRAQWERANRAVLDAEHDHSVPAPTEPALDDPASERSTNPVAPLPPGSPAAREEPAKTQTPSPPATPDRSRPWQRRPVVLGMAAVVAAAVVALLVTVLPATSGSSGHPSPSPSDGVPKHPTAADCPLHLPDPPRHPPLHRGDGSSYVGDVTLQDCTTVRPGVTVVKQWRLKNAGTVAWRGYTLHREDLSPALAECGTPGIVAMHDTAPGELVTISVPVTTPDHAAYCFASLKMYDGSGRLAFRGARPINFQLLVS